MAKMGRPKIASPKRNKVMVRFDDELFQKLKKCAEENNLTVTETVHKAVEQMLVQKK